MSSFFLDTGYVIALESSDDQHHQQARDHWQTILLQRPQLVTTTHVFTEIVTFFNSRGRHEKAVEIGQRLRQSPSVRLLHVDEALFGAGWDYFVSRPDKKFSLADCISFVAMEREGLTEALCFDAHFEQAGFHRLPA